MKTGVKVAGFFKTGLETATKINNKPQKLS